MSSITGPFSSASRNQDDHIVPPRNKRPKQTNISVFKNAKSPHIKNSTFTSNTTNVNNVSGDNVLDQALKQLHSEVAPNAILNAGGRADEVKCYPGTREEVIGLIERWMDSNGEGYEAPDMMWLSGPAGAGKSAIVQTVAERCKERGVQVASFFFFRADPTRSSARPLVATLLYQILKSYPPARRAIATVLSNDPLIFDAASVQDHFNQLLLLPLQDVPHLLESTTRRPFVLLIDGLDECDSEKKTSQRQILRALDHLLMQDNCPFLVLVASRAESQITMAVQELTSPVQSIFLDDQYKPEKDIRFFVTGEFDRIKKAHPLAHTLSEDWPLDKDIEAIVKKSSGQFIYAATVMRYLANSSASPKLSFERVQGIVPIATSSPFAHLDAVYTWILSQADDQQAVMDLFSMKLLVTLLAPTPTLYGLFEGCLRTYNPRYTSEVLNSCMSDLAAILKPTKEGFDFFHASLPDFLKDKSRARDYYIDLSAFGTKVLPVLWMEAPQSGFTRMPELALHIFAELLPTPTPEITTAFLTTLPAVQGLDGVLQVARPEKILPAIYRFYYPHDMESYKKLVHHWVLWYVSQSCVVEEKLPYVSTCVQIAKTEHWVTRSLRAGFYWIS